MAEILFYNEGNKLKSPYLHDNEVNIINIYNHISYLLNIADYAFQLKIIGIHVDGEVFFPSKRSCHNGNSWESSTISEAITKK
ncbi:MAG: hypothetical protein NC344_10945 [Bacteroidales bacterium]|nr:hypothetical protein [Bacteroidales bacterium]MCM1148323.1 hypothetical protein [Bacteroidales bacterium]MCM1206985.1 hypothetical protein [Bacillota bacterium]MCM1511282.1 hypothetical protein [Clostridium sp.]